MCSANCCFLECVSCINTVCGLYKLSARTREKKHGIAAACLGIRNKNIEKGGYHVPVPNPTGNGNDILSWKATPPTWCTLPRPPTFWIKSPRTGTKVYISKCGFQHVYETKNFGKFLTMLGLTLPSRKTTRAKLRQIGGRCHSGLRLQTSTSTTTARLRKFVL